MKRTGSTMIMLILAAFLAAFLASCGGSAGNPATTAASATTTAPAATTTASTESTTIGSAAADSGTLAEYKGEMKAWVEKYDAELTKRASVLETITDPMNATADQIKGTNEFADLAAEAASSLQEIQPPTELASYHKAYAEGIATMSTGIAQYAKAMQEHSASGLANAMGPMSVAPQIDQAETSLEQALGFKLTSD